MKVSVIMGGNSSERDVSIMTGLSVYESIKNIYDVNLVELESDFKIIPNNCYDSDIIFIALHGGFGENGEIQAYLDEYNFLYTGSNSNASIVANDKYHTKLIAIEEEIPTPEFILINLESNPNIAFQDLDINFEGPYVVKPVNEGSTMGLSIIESKKDLDTAILLSKEFSNNILIEKYIGGKEVTVGIIGNRTLPIVEIVPKNNLYDYESKYTKGMSDYFVPADLPKRLTESIQEDALRLYKKIGCSNYSRVDFRVNSKGEYFLLEINTLPGLTPTSLLPIAAEEVGLDYQKLIETIISIALLKDEHYE